MAEAYVFINGECQDAGWFLRRREGEGLIVCADGGANHLAATGVRPDMILGDLDSIDPEVLARYRRAGVPVQEYPPAKDFTDTQLALEWVLAQGADRVAICCGLGDRFDHSLANVQLLWWLRGKGAAGRILTEKHEIFLVEGEREIRGEPGQEISFLPFTPRVEGITLQGFRYPLQDAAMVVGDSIGISNVFTQPAATVRVREGVLLAIRVLA